MEGPRASLYSRVFIVASLISASMSISCDVAWASTVQRLDGHSIKIPANMTINQVSKISDFDLFKVTDGSGELILTIYIGNFPDTKRNLPSSVKHTISYINGMYATSDRWNTTSTGYSGATLIQLNAKVEKAWPQFAHIFFTGLSLNDSMRAESIIKTFSKESTIKR
jgi:hypothetical protein